MKEQYSVIISMKVSDSTAATRPVETTLDR